MSEPGLVVGTVGYMSPEQALGRAVDFRSDQFSFGSILYEMATGRRAFERNSAPQTMSAIIEDEPPPIRSICPGAPAPLCWIVERCLAKDPRGRYASTEDLAADLAALRDRQSELAGPAAGAPPATAPARWRRWAPVWAVAALLALSALGAWSLRGPADAWKNPLAGATFTRLTDWEGSELDPAISKDGKFVAFVSDRDGPFDAWVTQVGSGAFADLSRGRLTLFHRDGLRTVGFADDASHVRMRVATGESPSASGETTLLVATIGGAPRQFLAVGAIELDWSPDGSRVAHHSAEPGDPLFVAEGSGSNSRLLCRGETGIHQHFPTWSPDGRWVYFVRGIPGSSDLDIWRVAASGGAPERLTQMRLPIAYLAFLDARTLLYTAPRPDGTGSGLYALDVERRVAHPVSFGLEEYLSIDASADGRRIVAAVAKPDQNLWTVPLSARLSEEAAARRYDVPSVRAAAPRFGPALCPVSLVEGRAQRALDVQGRRRDRSVARRRRGGSSRARRVGRREPDLLRRPQGGALTPLRDGFQGEEPAAAGRRFWISEMLQASRRTDDRSPWRLRKEGRHSCSSSCLPTAGRRSGWRAAWPSARLGRPTGASSSTARGARGGPCSSRP